MVLDHERRGPARDTAAIPVALLAADAGRCRRQSLRFLRMKVRATQDLILGDEVVLSLRGARRIHKGETPTHIVADGNVRKGETVVVDALTAEEKRELDGILEEANAN